MKRIVDIIASFIGLIVSAPILLPVMFMVWRQDGYSPFYLAPRVGKGRTPFRMVKLRSMVIDADRTGVDSTSAADSRITALGHCIRRYKFDELTQLWNVLKGDMSLVGPRPNVARETDMYTETERELLRVRPGITDFSSIVFSDEGEILKDHPDPDLGYNQLIRPWKSRLGLLYINNRSIMLDFQLILLTIVAVFSSRTALRGVKALLEKLGAPAEVISIATRNEPLIPYPPPGSDSVVESR